MFESLHHYAPIIQLGAGVDFKQIRISLSMVSLETCACADLPFLKFAADVSTIV